MSLREDDSVVFANEFLLRGHAVAAGDSEHIDQVELGRIAEHFFVDADVWC